MFKWILCALALALISGSLYLRFQNAAEARRQAAAIVTTDQSGADTTSAQAQLKSYAATHMGAGIDLMLTGSYQRAEAAVHAVAAAAQAANADLYTQAQKNCGGRRDSISQAKCAQEYISTRLSGVPTPAPMPPPRLADYQRHFPAPFWTPDLAGALMAGGAIALGYALIATKLWRRRR